MPTKLLLSLCFAFIAQLLLPMAYADDPVSSLTPRPAQWAQPVDSKYNLYRMTPTLYRSNLPDADAQLLLRQLGVITVVSFLEESDTTWLTTPGIAQVQVPLRTVHVDDADIISALRAIQTAEINGPVLIHCKHGLDRTGLVSAMYRIVVQGWSKQAALDEMRKGGFGDEARLKHGIKYVENVDVDDLRNALTSGACSTNPLAFCAVKALFGSLGAPERRL